MSKERDTSIYDLSMCVQSFQYEYSVSILNKGYISFIFAYLRMRWLSYSFILRCNNRAWIFFIAFETLFIRHPKHFRRGCCKLLNSALHIFPFCCMILSTGVKTFRITTLQFSAKWIVKIVKTNKNNHRVILSSSPFYVAA